MKSLRQSKLIFAFQRLKARSSTIKNILHHRILQKSVLVGGVVGVSFSALAWTDQGQLVRQALEHLAAPREPQSAQMQSQLSTDDPRASARIMNRQGGLPLQRGMAIVSRLSNPNAYTPGQGSDRNGHVLGVFDIRNPDTSTPIASTNWQEATNSVYRHEQWTNAVMGEIFGIEVDNSVTQSPQIFVGSAGSFVGIIDGATQYTGRALPRIGSQGGDVFKLDGNTGNVSILTDQIPSVAYNHLGGRGAEDISLPLNKSNGGIVKSGKIINGGSGYTNGSYLLTVSGSEGVGGTIWVTVMNGSVNSFTFGAAGSGYKGPITLSSIPGGGSGFEYEIELGYPLQTGTYSVPNGSWVGYGSTAGNFHGNNGGTAPLFTRNVSAGEVTGITITTGGSNFSENSSFTPNNRFTGVGNIGYNYARKVVYTSSLDNGLIYALDASTGAILGTPYDHYSAEDDPTNLAITHLLRLAVGISWNPKDNRLYFARVDANGYTESSNAYTFTHNEIVSIGLNEDGSINAADIQRKEMRIPKANVAGTQHSLITDIEFTSNGEVALLGEMSISGATEFRSTITESRFVKGSHNAIAREYRFDSGTSTWSTTSVDYKVGTYWAGYNNAGGIDFGYGNSGVGNPYYDSAVMTGDYIGTTTAGVVYGIQISPLSQGNYPTNTPNNHYVIDDPSSMFVTSTFEKTSLGDVDVFSGIDFPTEEVVLDVEDHTPPTDCNSSNDGIIVLSGNGLLPNTPYPVSYVKDGGPVQSKIIVSDGNGLLHIKDLGSGNYTSIQLNDPDNITSTTVAVNLICDPVITLGTITYPSTCNSTEGVIQLTGADPSTSYSVEYVKDNGLPVVVTVTSDVNGWIELTNLSPGVYTQIRINNTTTGQISNALQANLSCLPIIALGNSISPSACNNADGVIQLTGADPSTAYRIEYIKNSEPSVFVIVTSNASGVIELAGLSSGDYSQIRINDSVKGQVSNALRINLSCLPTIALGQVTAASSCTSADGVILLSGLEPLESYRVEYTLNGSSAMVSHDLVANENGVISITGLSRGMYRDIVIKDEVSQVVSNKLSVDLLAENEIACTPLPVVLVDFGIRSENESVHLQWSTNSEVNSSYFEIQHSQDARNWFSIAKLNAYGESQTTVSYQFTHVSVSAGENYYRLKMVDKDGTFTFSTIKSIQHTGSSRVVIIPNPVVDRIQIKSTEWEVIRSVRVIDVTGREVYRSGSQPSVFVDCTHMTEGIYFVIVENVNGTRSTHKILIKH